MNTCNKSCEKYVLYNGQILYVSKVLKQIILITYKYLFEILWGKSNGCSVNV